MRSLLVFGVVALVTQLCCQCSLAQTLVGTTTDPDVKFLSANSDAIEGTYSIVIDQPATKGIVVGESIISNLSASEILTINGVNVSLSAGMSPAGVVNRINEFTSATKVRALLETNFADQVTLSSVDFGGEVTVVATGIAAGFTTTPQIAFGTDVSGRIGFNYAVGTGNVLSAAGIELCFRTVDIAGLNTGSGNLGMVTITDCNGFFSESQSLVAGDQPVSLVHANFNGDGSLDLIATDLISNEISVILGQGIGSFAHAVHYSAGDSPTAIEVADIDGDGSLDVAVANSLTNSLTILLGDGEGGFAITSKTEAGDNPNSIASGDFNGDGLVDLATANDISNDVTILLGSGDGTFSIGQKVSVGVSPNSIIKSDFDGDAILDIAVANALSNSVSVLMGEGNGTFGELTSFAVGNFPTSLVADDFNGDGVIDLVTVNGAADSISTLIGIGNGNFNQVADTIL
ncbi:MAG: FG-GAP-like repeat-containing protein, partial [Planctomycetota bacterium]